MATSHWAATERPRRPTSKKQNQRVDKSEYDKRYGAGYNRICAIAHRRTRQVCCVCLWCQSSEIHHVFYGSDVIGWSVFPVDAECHARICHSKENWITDKDNPVWGNRNTEEFIKKLRDNYKFLRCGIEK